MKVTDIVPGKQVPYEDGNIIAQMILSTINPHHLPPLALWEELTTLNKEAVIGWIQNCLTENFYLLYTYYLKKPHHDLLTSHRVFLADRKSVIKFMEDHFDEDWGEGIDIMISDTHYQKVIMGNHDGVLTARKEGEKDE